MSQLIWAAIREYIAAEVKLALVRCGAVHAVAETKSALEEQSTRMETEVRRLIDALPQATVLSDEQINAINMHVPFR